MNVYLIDGGTQADTVWEDFESYVGHYEYYRAIGLYAAETRGKAAALFNQEYHFDWTEPKSIRLIQKDIDGPAGLVINDVLWVQAHAVLAGGNDASEFYEWRTLFEEGYIGNEDSDE